MTDDAKRVLRAMRKGEKLPREQWSLWGMCDLAHAGLVEVERDARGDPVRWVESDAGKKVVL